MIGALLALAAAAAGEPARWPGVDEAVVERLAQEAGRHPWPPLLDAQGDLRSFLFLSAGAAGGFAMGYLYRLLFAERPRAARGDRP